MADVRERLKHIDPSSIQTATHVQREFRHAFQEYQDSRHVGQDDDHAQPGNDAGATRAPQGSSSQNPSRKTPKEPVKPPSLDPADILQVLTRQQSTFTQRDMQMEIARRLEGRREAADKPDILKVERKVREHYDFISLGTDRVDRPRYTSRELLETELEMRNASDRMVERRYHALKARTNESSGGSGLILGEDQKCGLAHVTGAEGLAILTGLAGTGKSTLLKEAHRHWTAEGYRVRGTAVAGIAADGLQKGSAIKSRTLASTLAQLDHVGVLEIKLHEQDQKLSGINGRSDRARKLWSDVKSQRDRVASRIDDVRLSARDVIVVDEAGMVGSRDMKRLLAHADKAGAKVVLVGDAEQLQAIDAGGPFRALSERHGSVRVSEVRRQKADWQKQATRDFGDGFTDDALGAYLKNGHIRQFDRHDTAREQITTDWTESRTANPSQTHLMLAFTNADVTALNSAAREIYREEGRLGKDETVKTADGEKQFAPGDRLYFLEPNKTLGVMNGSLGTVEDVRRVWDSDHFRMTVKLDSGAQVRFTTDEYSKFTHGFASTMHKSQGATTDRAHVLASRYMDRHAAYVAMSRHVHQVDMYYGADEFKNYDGLVYKLSRDRRKDTTLDYLRRAEEQGKGETWWQKVAKIVKPEKAATQESTAEQSKKSSVRTLMERFFEEENKSPEQKRQEREERAAAARLRDILDRNGNKRSTGYSW